MTLHLSDDIQSVKGVGPTKAKLLAKLGIKSVKDALFLFPRDYMDMAPLKFNQAPRDKIGAFPCIVIGQPVNKRAKSGMVLTKLPVTDGNTTCTVVFFNQPYLVKIFKRGDRLLLVGKLEKNYGELTISSPEWKKILNDKPIELDRFCPIYPLTKGLSQNNLRSIIKEILKERQILPEILPKDLVKEYKLFSRDEAIRNIHFPKNQYMLMKARERLAFDELLNFQLAMGLARKHITGEKRQNKYHNVDLSPFMQKLPFSLTRGQQKVIKDIIRDLTSERNMNRLIQGDVGSGKTVVACAALYLAVSNGLQGVFMAPTEILAQQHLKTLKQFLSVHGIVVEILKGGMTDRQRKKVLEDLKNGRINVLVGTHALIQEDVEFFKLGMIITDEQHRFGVKQREKLIKKGQYPDILVMSATPIPRTLAMVLYSDLDISVIDTMPKDRKPIDTFVVGSEMRKRVYDFMEQEIKKGHLAYVVCPAVEENELNVTSVEKHVEELKKAYPHLKICALHGKMKNEEKDLIIKNFKDRKIQVLVATTVVEVGVDVPYATLMLVENAERFGLAQLHQLRGRVGRSNLKSYCILISDSKDEIAKARLKYMMQCHDGFELAQKDLELRGPGEFLGTRQHGFYNFKIANIASDMKLLETTKKVASRIVEEDLLNLPEYESLNKELQHKLQAFFL